MTEKLQSEIIVAASLAKAEGFQGTHDALVEMLAVLRLPHSSVIKAPEFSSIDAKAN